MEIKSGQSHHMSHAQRSVQASRHSDQREAQAEVEQARSAAKQEPERNATQSVQDSEARFFAIESREEEAAVDPRQQVRVMRERVRQTYAEQENREARQATQAQQAEDVQAEKRAQRNEAREPIDLIA